ncbi:DUF2157 domain-containing protein [Nocardioides mangrovi]|uniref:DUF2157 domain-containing protein n=1 Tax=Nocardioides mangrovi TaxID=2874580 RepID=A0ABS7UJM2_9ACTN|nr:DUF2157 domain-containing protein [Nocardioides mangrovi]MBZ5741220.1 DUF2157 domain-containing protein [Nocardioides mangrovi]
MTVTRVPDSLDQLLERWVEAGVITPVQADEMRVVAQSPAPPSRRTPLVEEALAYVGGAVALAGCGLLAAYYWSDLASGARLGVVLGAAVALLLGGAAVPDRLGSAGRRLRGVLWLASTAAWAGAVAVLLGDVLSSADLRNETVVVLVAAATLAYAAALWAALRYGLQQAATMASAALLAAAVVDRLDLPGEPGMGVWAVGLLWAALGLARVLSPPETPVLLGAGTAVLGAMMSSTTDAGLVLVLVTVVGVVVAAVVRRDLALLALGGLAALVNVPAAMARWFSDSTAAAIALVVVGAALVALSVVMARRGAGARSPGPERSRGAR